MQMMMMMMMIALQFKCFFFLARQHLSSQLWSSTALLRLRSHHHWHHWFVILLLSLSLSLSLSALPRLRSHWHCHRCHLHNHYWLSAWYGLVDKTSLGPLNAVKYWNHHSHYLRWDAKHPVPKTDVFKNSSKFTFFRLRFWQNAAHQGGDKSV